MSLTRHDYFFKEGSLPPGATFPVCVSGVIPVRESPFNPNGNTKPSATAKVMFAQFTDSWFGDDQTREKLAKDRYVVQAFLEKLVDVYQRQGEDAFLKLLDERHPEQSYLESTLHHLRATQSQSGTAAAVEDVTHKLQLAATRQLQLMGTK